MLLENKICERDREGIQHRKQSPKVIKHRTLKIQSLTELAAILSMVNGVKIQQ